MKTFYKYEISYAGTTVEAFWDQFYPQSIVSSWLNDDNCRLIAEVENGWFNEYQIIDGNGEQMGRLKVWERQQTMFYIVND